MEINNITATLPHDPFKVTQGNSITAEPIPQTYNGIQYSFDHWHDGSTTYTRTFITTDHATYTAHYTGIPKPVTIISSWGPPGSYVTITWQEHENPNVSQYQVWRKVKHTSQGGWWEGPTLMATLNRGTNSFTDTEYTFTDGYTHDLLKYDIRAYYSIENSYAEPHWTAVFARQELEKRVAESDTAHNLPTKYAISCYPNPFNLATNLSFQLMEDARVNLKVYNIQGRQVNELVDATLHAGYYQISWDGKDNGANPLSSGIYLVILIVKPAQGEEPQVLSSRLILIK